MPAITTSESAFTRSSAWTPSSFKTVAVASVPSTTSTVSQPTISSHESADGTRLPRTPKAARERTIVGTEPRGPAVATMPTAPKDRSRPIAAAITLCATTGP
jgi:hypothetical protein